MRPLWKDILLAAFFGMVLPWMIVRLCLYFRPEEPSPASPPSVVAPETTLPRTTFTMRLRRGEDVTEMDLEEYLTGVVLAELPASFEEETKKAQAVAARTFTWKAVTTGGKHGDGSVCVDSTCCQAYTNPEDYEGDASSVEAARQAVNATAGYVLTYEGELIEATYFSCSGGNTEDAVAVWGTDFPYLRATSSPGEEGAAHYTDTVTFTPEEFQSALGISLTGAPSGWFGMTTYTSGGGVATMTIGGKTYSGTELRRLLGLRSTAFTVTPGEGSVTVTTRGYGHRVGMSQYGADAMAASGRTWEEILRYYYRGVRIDKLEDLG